MTTEFTLGLRFAAEVLRGRLRECGGVRFRAWNQGGSLTQDSADLVWDSQYQRGVTRQSVMTAAS
jgi:hypothetical protein